MGFICLRNALLSRERPRIPAGILSRVEQIERRRVSMQIARSIFQHMHGITSDVGQFHGAAPWRVSA